MYSTDHIILRDVLASGRINHRLDRRPLRVATLINEAAFVEQGNELVHHRTVFFEDRIHDWDYTPVDASNPEGPGDFRYYTRLGEKADVLIVYAFTTQAPAGIHKFDPQTGKPLASA